mgnify:CR=1 FL=1
MAAVPSLLGTTCASGSPVALASSGARHRGDPLGGLALAQHPALTDVEGVGLTDRRAERQRLRRRHALGLHPHDPGAHAVRDAGPRAGLDEVVAVDLELRALEGGLEGALGRPDRRPVLADGDADLLRRHERDGEALATERGPTRGRQLGVLRTDAEGGERLADGVLGRPVGPLLPVLDDGERVGVPDDDSLAVLELLVEARLHDVVLADLDALLDWLAADPDRWPSLNGDALLQVSGQEPVLVVDDDAQQPQPVHGLTSSGTHPQACCELCRQPVDKKPDTLTHLTAEKMVAKSDPRLGFRAALDATIALAVWLQIELAEPWQPWLADIRSRLGNIMRADAVGEPLAAQSIVGLNEDELHRLSHQPLRYLDHDHLVPEAGHGRDAALLNLLRSKIRETETVAAQVFITRSFEVLRPDILQALNRLSSTVYVMMILSVAKHPLTVSQIQQRLGGEQ